MRLRRTVSRSDSHPVMGTVSRQNLRRNSVMNQWITNLSFAYFSALLVGSSFKEHRTMYSPENLCVKRIDQVIPGIQVRQLVGRILEGGKQGLARKEWSSSLGDESGSIDFLAADSCSKYIQQGTLVSVEGFCQSYGGHLRLIVTSMRRPTQEEAEKLVDSQDGYSEAFGFCHPNLVSYPRRTYGCLLIRGRRCVLVRSLEHPLRWPGLRIPNAPAEGKLADE